jgi:hypothetical protein
LYHSKKNKGIFNILLLNILQPKLLIIILILFLRFKKTLEYTQSNPSYSNNSNSSIYSEPTNVFEYLIRSINMISLPSKWFMDIDLELKDLKKSFVGFH